MEVKATSAGSTPAVTSFAFQATQPHSLGKPKSNFVFPSLRLLCESRRVHHGESHGPGIKKPTQELRWFLVLHLKMNELSIFPASGKVRLI
ncbi:hypothetical protein A3C09_03570 [Candidatus Uhrbacteria bacterium RIFCSPHIGHO2_02_FULL_47_44]|nr:MAG: hypothetical protein A2839_04725 [Candidatus Uhrbacteria bacterium RIFCSPHIGHO2_01_FULL_47_10]OGL71285.1 MAG: hypothetical protein A3C09_03570 [Candidatus Uhrbacteria bacterium RIFCSPHIGHO2_02_FULL_47_44]OGL80379.1 MAG: hypothetical protein A3B20_03110 [Candidatus Uhrbacteria bacterium RIFCSPLOWO2_01_FULL_47_17]